jgi:hypothetical protein
VNLARVLEDMIMINQNSSIAYKFFVSASRTGILSHIFVWTAFKETLVCVLYN